MLDTRSAGRHDQRLAAEIERHVVELQRRNRFARFVQRLPNRCEDLGHVGRFHEPVPRGDLVEPGAPCCYGHAVDVGDLRDFLRRQRHQHDLVMQHLVVLEMMQQHRRRHIRNRGQEHRHAGHAQRLAPLDVGNEEVEWQRCLGEDTGHLLPSATPRAHQQVDHRASREREPAALDELDHVGAEEGKVNDQEERRQRHDRPERPVPDLPLHHGEQDRRDQHRSRDGNAIGRRESVGRLERQDECHGAEPERPIDAGHVDLTDLGARRVDQSHPRHEAELHRLLGQRECPGDQRLRCDGRRHRGDRHHRIERPSRHQAEERIGDGRASFCQQHRALAEIVEHQRRQHETPPGQPDRAAAEVSHVGVECLGAGEDQEDRPEDEEAAEAVALQVRQSMGRIERGEHPRVQHDAPHAEHRETTEPEHHESAEEAADTGGAALLDPEQSGQDTDGERHHPALERRCGDVETFHGREDRNRRRDHAVAIEQCRTEEAQHQQQFAAMSRRPARPDQRQ